MRNLVLWIFAAAVFIGCSEAEMDVGRPVYLGHVEARVLPPGDKLEGFPPPAPSIVHKIVEVKKGDTCVDIAKEYVPNPVSACMDMFNAAGRNVVWHINAVGQQTVRWPLWPEDTIVIGRNGKLSVYGPE